MKVLLDILKKVALSILTEKVIKKAVIEVLKHLAAKTDNKLDDEIVKEVENALNGN